MYTFNLISNKGVIYKLWGYGIERISDSIPAVDFNEARNLFPHVPNAAFDVLEEKPVDILIGLNFYGLHPEGGTGINKVGNLKALKSEFSHGWVIAGSHPNIKTPKIKLNVEAVSIQNSMII